MAKIVDWKTTKVVLVPLASVTSVSSPKLSEFNGVGSVDITCQLLASSKIPSYGDDKTTTEASICQGEDIVAIVGASYDGEFTAFHDFAAAGVLSTTDISAVFTSNSPQWAVLVRSGPAFETALAVGQKVSVYPLSSGRLQEMRGSGDGFLKAKVKLYPLGGAVENVALVA